MQLEEVEADRQLLQRQALESEAEKRQLIERWESALQQKEEEMANLQKELSRLTEALSEVCTESMKSSGSLTCYHYLYLTHLLHFWSKLSTLGGFSLKRVCQQSVYPVSCTAHCFQSA